MNIENLYSMLSSLRQFTNLLKQDMSLETLNAIRELKGFEVLENYEKMFDVDGVGTKNAIRNYIVNEINSLMELVSNNYRTQSKSSLANIGDNSPIGDSLDNAIIKWNSLHPDKKLNEDDIGKYFSD